MPQTLKYIKFCRILVFKDLNIDKSKNKSNKTSSVTLMMQQSDVFDREKFIILCLVFHLGSLPI